MRDAIRGVVLGCMAIMLPAFVLVGCKEKVGPKGLLPPEKVADNAEPPGRPTKGNFDKIADGMTEKEVDALLGPAKKVDRERDGAIEKDWDAGLITEKGRRYRVEISVNFREGKVVRKKWDLDAAGNWPAK